MRKYSILLIGLLLSCTGLLAQDWVELFNGKNLKGWEKLDGEAEFRVEDGEVVGISRTGTPNTFLATKKSYGDFILEYEMKMDRGINSGVQFRSTATLPDGSSRVNGYQVESDDHDHRPWAGGIYSEASPDWLYPLTYNPDAPIHYKRGEWNKIRVEAIGTTLRTFVNGISFANLVDDRFREGFIALQVHNIPRDGKLAGKEIRWKNIRIIASEPQKYMKRDAPLAPEVNLLTNELSPLQLEEGWSLLWNGLNSEGWKGAMVDHFPQEGWSMKDGVLTINGSLQGASTQGGDIISLESFENFILEVDFLITKGANSGIKYFVDPSRNIEAGSAIGCEYQIIDDENFLVEGKPLKENQTMASLYDLISPDASLYGIDDVKKRFSGVGTWNRARIEVRGSKVFHYLNGAKVVEYERGSQVWKALVLTSKFGVWPTFGEAKSGHILLQDHGHSVSFKNIKILEL